MELPLPPYEYRVTAMNEYQQQDTPTDLSEQVRKAFDDVRHRDLAGVSKLQDSGKAIVTLLPPYLRDSNVDVRREAVSLLSLSKEPDAIPLLILALNDLSVDVREKASRALYEKLKPSAIAEQDTLGVALMRSIQTESAAAAALLLSAYFPNSDMENALQAAMKRKPIAEVKLFDHSTPVPVSLPIQVALAHHGSPEAITALIPLIQNASVADAEFLLDAIQEADSSAVLKAMAGFLGDARQSTTLRHSAPRIRLRVCDLAVNAFIKRFEWKVSFKSSEMMQYDNAQIDEVRRLFDKTVPDRPVPELAKPE